MALRRPTPFRVASNRSSVSSISNSIPVSRKFWTDTALAKRVSQMGAELSMTSPSEFGEIIESDRQRYGQIVAESNLATPK